MQFKFQGIFSGKWGGLLINKGLFLGDEIEETKPKATCSTPWQTRSVFGTSVRKS
jgi:hypothetical protein